MSALEIGFRPEQVDPTAFIAPGQVRRPCEDRDRALILGDRYQSFYYPEVARACGRYVDAVSSNLNASWNDGSFARFYLETLHRLTGKQLLIGEFYMCARDNRSGNKNDRGVFPVVAT